MRYIMKGESEIEAMHAAGPARQYFTAALPLRTLVDELAKQKTVRYVQIQRGAESLLVQGG